LPLDIINGPLMAGMAEVGRLFNNELIVAEVLQREAMLKAAVNSETFMEKANVNSKARIVLATVKRMSMISGRISSRSS
jgi:5-methyltetrahydrofolate--homocysteine methyltransferase